MTCPSEAFQWLACALLATAPAFAHGQEHRPLPRLGPEADSRDSRAYYEHGIDRIVEHPDSAADAFYWAARLDPTWAQPVYARWVGEHLVDRDRLYQYVEDDDDVLRSPEVQRIDSLAFRAFQLDPFFFRRLEYLWYETYWRQAVIWSWGRMPFSEQEMNYILDSLLTADTTTHVKAWLAYSNRQFRASLGHYAKLLGTDMDPARVHTRRGHIFSLTGQHDSARVAFNDAIDELRQRDEDELVLLYESKAMLEYCVGRAFEAMGNRVDAREAYARALVEDMAFYPAHQRLGLMELAAGDSTGAVLEFELATQSDPTVSAPLLLLGNTL